MHLLSRITKYTDYYSLSYDPLSALRSPLSATTAHNTNAARAFFQNVF